MADLGNAAMLQRFSQDPALGGSEKKLKMRNLAGDIIGKNWTRSIVRDRTLAPHSGAYQTDRFIGSPSPAVETPEIVKHQMNSFNLLDEKIFNVLRFTSAFYLSFQTWKQSIKSPDVDLARDFTRKNAEAVVRLEENAALIMMSYAYQTRTLPSNATYVDIYTADKTGTTANPLFCPPANPHTYIGVAAQANMPAANMVPSQQALIDINTSVSQFRDDKGWSLNAKPVKFISSADWGPLWDREVNNVMTPDSADNADNINKYLGYSRKVVIINDLPLQTTIIETSLCESDPEMYKIQRTNLGEDIVKQTYDDDLECWKFLISTYQRLAAPAGWAGYYTTAAQ